MDSMDSIFEVKSINKQGFELYNLVNEKTYRAKNQIKMVNYRRVFSGDLLHCKLITIDGEYYLSNIEKIIKPHNKIEAYRLAISMQMEKPSLLYEDNEEKLKEIKQNVVLLGQKYSEFFKTEEIYTTNTKLNELLNIFNEFVDGGEKVDYEAYTENPQTADVLVKFDKNRGLLTISKNKPESTDDKEFSYPTLLYSSKAFEKFVELSNESQTEPLKRESKIGRNEPCLCGSGKKYKKCCL